MEQIYAIGVVCIEYVQYWFEDNATFFEMVNHLCNPHYVIEYMFPLMSVIDSVFAAQLLLCMAFGGWLNAVMKWWFLEDRPYWWIRETSFYLEHERPVLQQTLQTCETGPGSPSGHSMTAAMMLVLSLMWISHVMHDKSFYLEHERPVLQQTLQTCETGPGSPSGHSMTAAMMLVLSLMWISHVMHDKKCYIWWWKHVMYPLFAAALVSVMLARLFIATHFPHQCLFGALVGSFLAPALCIYVSDPFVWRYGSYASYETSKVVACHILATIAAAVIAAATYLGIKWSGWDPHYTVQLAFRWCQNPETIQVSTTPMFSIVMSMGNLLGWSLCVTPAIAKYRHYTKNRSILISLFCTAVILLSYQHMQDTMCKSDAVRYYIMQFIMATVKPMLLLRAAPAVAMWPFSDGKSKVE